MKRPKTKFHADTMSHSKVIRSKKCQNSLLGQNFLAAVFFTSSLSYNNRFWYVFASL